MALRIVAALRKAGAGRITVLGRPEIARVAIPGGGIDDVLDFETGGFHMLFSEDGIIPVSLVRRMEGIDWAVNMLASKQTTIAPRLFKAGIQRAIDIDPTPRKNWADHITEQWLEDLRGAGLDTRVGPPSIQVDFPERLAARCRLHGSDCAQAEPIAILHPGSGSRAKCWPTECFVQLAKALKRRGWNVAVLLGPVEAEKMPAEEMELLHSTAPTLQHCGLADVRDLLADCDLFVGNDSGITHLAAAVGTRALAIFGPTDPAVWRPLGTHVGVIRDTASTWPTVDEVLTLVQAFTRDIVLARH